MKEIAKSYEESIGYFKKWLEGIKPEHLTENLLGGPSINWELGHIAIHRHLLARKLGFEEPEPSWKHAFDFGSKPGEPLPLTCDELIAEIERITPEIVSRLSNLSAEEREKKDERGKTLGENIAFFFWHDGYHFGRLGYIRARLGYPWPFSE